MSEFLALIQSSAFSEITALLTLSAIAGIVGLFLKQPMIVSFIAVGLLIGPSGFGLVTIALSVYMIRCLSLFKTPLLKLLRFYTATRSRSFSEYVEKR